MTLSMSSCLDMEFYNFLDRLYDIERYKFEGEHSVFLALLRKHYGSDIEDAYSNWYDEGEDE